MQKPLFNIPVFRRKYMLNVPNTNSTLKWEMSRLRVLFISHKMTCLSFWEDAMPTNIRMSLMFSVVCMVIYSSNQRRTASTSLGR
jgi:hypothetical protein